MTSALSRHDINAERARRGWTLKAFANRAEVNYYRACRVLRGKTNDDAALSKLARALRKAGGCN